MLSNLQLYELIEAVRTELLGGKLEEVMTFMNRSGKLESFMQLIGLESLLNAEIIYNPRAKGKIVVIGDSKISNEVIWSIGKRYNLPKNRFEIHPEYDDAKRFNYRKMRNSNGYAAVVFGATPHSTACKGTYSSVVSAMENEEGYPPAFRMDKITKSSFGGLIESLIEQGTIAA